MNKRKRRLALYPGTFDPITNGHISLIHRAVNLFDEIVVAVARSTHKHVILFSAEERAEMIKASVGDKSNIRVEIFDSLLAEYAKEIGACAIIRGLRAVSDFEYEFQMALMNRRMARQVETVFLMPALSWVYLSSTIVKDVAKNGGDVSGLVPDPVAKALQAKFGRK
jgi:pantetheine-phosphate adenylyltransferase